jgi:hypothetical protein
MDSFSPLTTSSLNIHHLEIFTPNLVVQGNSTGPFRRATDLVNRKDRDYIIVDAARITPLGRQANPTPLSTPLMVARQHIHLVSLAPQLEPENTTGGLGGPRESGVRKIAYPCYLLTDIYVIVGQCHMVEGSTLENLMAVSELFLPITAATLYISSMPNTPLPRELVIINKEKIQAMYLMPSPTATQKLDEPPNTSFTSPLNDQNSTPPTERSSESG